MTLREMIAEVLAACLQMRVDQDTVELCLRMSKDEPLWWSMERAHIFRLVAGSEAFDSDWQEYLQKEVLSEYLNTTFLF